MSHRARLAIVLWVVLLAAVSVRVAIARPGTHSVVPVYANAAKRWLHNENLYAPAPGLDIFLYGPGFAAFFAGFELLPVKAAEVLWRLLSAVVLLAGMWKLTQGWPAPQRGTAFAWLALLATPCVNNGQANVIIAGLAALGVASLRQDRLRIAAICFGIAAAIKFYPVALLLLAVVAVPRMWKPAAVALAVLMLAPWLLPPLEYSTRLPGSLVAAIQVDDRAATLHLPRAPHDWTIIPRVLFGTAIERNIAFAVSVVVGLFLAVMIWKRRSIEAAWLVGSIWMTLFGPCTEIPTYMLLAPAAVWWHARQPGLLTAIALCLLAVPVLRGIFPSGEAAAFRIAAPLGAALLLIEALRQPQAQSLVIADRIRIAIHSQSTFRPDDRISVRDEAIVSVDH